MVFNSLKAVFFIAGGAVVAGGAAYVTGALDIFLPEEPTAVASLPAPQSAPSAPATTAPDSASPKVEAPAAPAAGQAAESSEEAPEIIVPAFDLVRVEPDGSVVIAGRAAPVANVEIVTGATTIGRGESNEVGDFAIVLDERLKPGDYTIVLRSTTRDAIVATSTETAIVSVPDHPNGQVLALVEQPGEPSRFITVPEAAAVKQDRPAAAEQQKADEQRPAPGAEQAAAPEPPAEDVKPAEGPAPETAAAPEQEQKPAEQSASAAPAPPAATQEPVAEEQELAAAPAEAAPDIEESGGQDEQEQMAAVAETPQQSEQPAPAPAEQPRIAVEAVEIEGRRVFVAGRAEPGARVRVYANEILLGDSEASDGGRFLVEAERDLPVGDYIVRADLLGPNAEVVARAAVPFEREPGESVAAVAAPEPQPLPTQPAPVPADDMAAAPSEPAKPAETATSSDQKPASPSSEQAAAPTEPAPEGPREQQVASAPAARSNVASDAVQPPVASATPGAEVTAPKLQNVAGAVIIRRGDTLWRISKRVYGRGVRYTTLYLANQDQIQDPDRIWPGQIFSVPGKTDKGEDADMSAVADRLPEAQPETR